jgi:MFS family permease
VLTRPFVLLWLCGWFYFLGIGAVSPLLPRFVKDRLGYGNVVVGVVVALMAISAVAVRPIAGQMANRRGRRLVTTMGTVALAVSFALYSFPSLAVLVPGRLLTGVAEALFFTAAATMVAELAPEHRRGAAVSYFSVAVYLGTGVGPAIGVWVTSESDIRVGFIAASLLGLIALVISRFLVETKPGPVGSEIGMASVKRVSPIALLPGCVLALGVVSNVTFASFMPLYADQLHTGVAGVYLVYTAVVIVVRVFGARIPDRLGPNKCGTLATVMIAAGMALVALSGSVWGLYAGSATMAAGISFLYPTLMKLVVDRAPHEERASAVATFTAFFDIATGLGGLLIGGVAAAGGYRSSFATAAVSALVGLLILHTMVLRTHASTTATATGP